MSFKDNLICATCIREKHVKTSFKSINNVYTQISLELIHLNLFDPTRTTSINENVTI